MNRQQRESQKERGKVIENEGSKKSKEQVCNEKGKKWKVEGKL